MSEKKSQAVWFTGGEGGSRRLLIGKANFAFLKASVQADVQAAVGCHFAEGFAVAGATLGGGGSRPEGQTGLCEKAVDRRTEGGWLQPWPRCSSPSSGTIRPRVSESHAETSARWHHACGGGRVFPTDQDRLVAAGEALWSGMLGARLEMLASQKSTTF